MLAERTVRLDREAARRRRAVLIATATSFLVGAVELVLAKLLALESLLAEGVHTLLDGLDSVIVLISVVLAARPADRSHQFGHGKFEAVGAAIEGAFITCAGVWIGYRAILRLITGQTPDAIPPFVCAVMAVTALLYLAVSIFLMREAKATKSPAIFAEALHLRTHIYITGGMAGGLLIGSLGGYVIVDTLLALGISVCLIAISVRVFRTVFAQFTDEAIPPEEIEELGRIIDRFSGSFIEVHGIRTRQSGAERHIEMHLVVDPKMTVFDAHALAHRIEDAICDPWPTARAAIHVEPLNTDAPDHALWLSGQPKVRTEDDSPDEREFIH